MDSLIMPNPCEYALEMIKNKNVAILMPKQKRERNRSMLHNMGRTEDARRGRKGLFRGRQTKIQNTKKVNLFTLGHLNAAS